MNGCRSLASAPSARCGSSGGGAATTTSTRSVATQTKLLARCCECGCTHGEILRNRAGGSITRGALRCSRGKRLRARRPCRHGGRAPDQQLRRPRSVAASGCAAEQRAHKRSARARRGRSASAPPRYSAHADCTRADGRASGDGCARPESGTCGARYDRLPIPWTPSQCLTPN